MSGEYLLLISLQFKTAFEILGYHDQNGWAYNWLTTVCMIIVMTPSVSADHFTQYSILKLLK